MNVYKRVIQACLCAMLLARFAPASASDEETKGIQTGSFMILPSLSLKAGYDSNIYQISESAEDDFIVRVTPALSVALPMESWYLKARGEADAVRYLHHDNASYSTYLAGAEVGALYPGGLDWTLADDFRKGHQVLTSEFIKEDYFLNAAFGKVSYAFEDAFRIQLSAYNNNYAYDKSDDLDRNENTVAGAFFYQFMPKTSVLVEVAYANIRYGDGGFEYKDNDIYQLRGGLTWDFTGKSTGELKAGWMRKAYDERDDEDFFVLAGSVRTIFSEFTTVRAELSRGTQESDYTDNPYYLSNSASAGLSQEITEKISGRAGIKWRMDEYPIETTESSKTAKRQDNWLDLNLDLKFQMFRWMTINAGYGYESRDSNFNDFDYEDHRVEIGATISF